MWWRMRGYDGVIMVFVCFVFLEEKKNKPQQMREIPLIPFPPRKFSQDRRMDEMIILDRRQQEMCRVKDGNTETDRQQNSVSRLIICWKLYTM